MQTSTFSSLPVFQEGASLHPFSRQTRHSCQLSLLVCVLRKSKSSNSVTRDQLVTWRIFNRRRHVSGAWNIRLRELGRCLHCTVHGLRITFVEALRRYSSSWLVWFSFQRLSMKLFSFFDHIICPCMRRITDVEVSRNGVRVAQRTCDTRHSHMGSRKTNLLRRFAGKSQRHFSNFTRQAL